MSDDDRTIDADEGVLDDLKRLAAEVRSRQAGGLSTGDVTVDADESTMEQLRRFAADARAESSDSDESNSSVEDLSLGSFVRDAAEVSSDAGSSAVTPDAWLPPLEDLSPLPAPEAGRYTSEVAGARPAPDLAPVRSRRETEPEPAAELDPLPRLDAPGAVEKGGGWRPPARSVLPVDPDKSVSSSDGPWKAVAAILGLLLAAVAVYVAFGIVTGDDPADEPPTDEIVPAQSTIVPDTTAAGG